MGSSLRHRLPAAARRATRVAGPALAALLLATPAPAVAAPLGAKTRIGERAAQAAAARRDQLQALRSRFVARALRAADRVGLTRRLTPALIDRSTSALQRLRRERQAPTLRGLLGATLALRGLTRALRSPAGREAVARQPTQLARPLKPLARLMVRPEGLRANAVARTAQRLLLRPAALRLFRLPVLREVARTTVARELAVALRLEARMLRQGPRADAAALKRASDAVRAARALLQTIGGAHPGALAASRSSAGRDSEDPLPHARPRAAVASTARPATGNRGALSRAATAGFTPTWHANVRSSTTADQTTGPDSFAGQANQRNAVDFDVL